MAKAEILETARKSNMATPVTTTVFSSFDSLKGRIREHYELCSDYYYSLWGEHIHHGYFTSPEESKEVAQVKLIELLLQRSGIAKESSVLDVGCGIGGTSRYLALEYGCSVAGVTISGNQVKMAQSLSLKANPKAVTDESGFFGLGNGKVRFIELDAETMGEYFTTPPNDFKFDVVWISEALSHFPNKSLFFENAAKLLNAGGTLVIADWFKASNLSTEQVDADIKPIEDGMLLPPLCTQSEYVEFAVKNGLKVHAEPFDISDKVAKTWDISLSLVSSPSLWALAFSQGRDFVAFLQAFRAMKRGYANGTFRYAVMAFRKDQKP